MKTIGMIGGTSCHSTRHYYRIINEYVNRELGEQNAARIIMSSINFQDIFGPPDWDYLEGMFTAEAKRPIGRVLDVGTGSGVLALAAVALGAESAVGFDLDPVAIEAAREAANQNELAARVRFFTGPIEALGKPSETYPLVLANLLKREMLPIASELARRVDRSGWLVLAGLLEEDVAEVRDRFAREGLRVVGRRSVQDSIGVWVGLCLSSE